MMDMAQYLDIFVEESRENLQNMNQALLGLEKNQNDMELLDEIFRIAHTLKGMSRTMGFDNVGNLTHEMENLLQSLKEQKIHIDPNVINILFESFDRLESYINEIADTGSEGNISADDLIEVFREILNLEESDKQSPTEKASALTESEKRKDPSVTIKLEEFARDTVQKAISEGYSCYKIRVELNPNCMLKSARAFIIFNTLEKDCEILKSSPPVEEIEDEKFDLSFELIILTKLSEKSIQQKIMDISEVEQVIVERFVLDEIIKNTVPSEKEDESDHQTELSKHAEHSNSEEHSNRLKKAKLGKTVRVDIERLDMLMNLVSELIITRSRLADIDSFEKRHNNMNEAIEYLERITTNLHDAVMKVRMVPIERVFNRFPRMVRDLAKELGKEIILDMSGEETEVDRTVIDEIGDPLIHLIRNSIDHGIEDPETRKKLGKPESGTVRLTSYPDGNNVVIEVEDDGRGIDIDKVKSKAVQKGLLTEEQAENLDEKEAVHLLFQPGFSTTDQVSDLSGRGVGLDVVKTKIESLGGVVEVKTSPGKGSTFTIRLPLTLAIIQALLVNVGDEKYAIPLNSIKEIITIQTAAIRKVESQEVVLYRNTTLPLLRMKKILNVPCSKENQEEENLIVVVVKKGDKTAGFIVDDLIGQQEIVIKSLGKFLSNIKAIAGATILGNGQVALIVDTNSLF